MPREYTVLDSGFIFYEENGISYTIPDDPANSDYQRYLRWLENPDADESGTL